MSRRIPLEIFEELEKDDVQLPKVPIYHNQFSKLNGHKSFATFIAEKKKIEKAEKEELRKQRKVIEKGENVSKSKKSASSHRSNKKRKSSPRCLSNAEPSKISKVELSPDAKIRLKEMYENFEKECEKIDNTKKLYINVDDDLNLNDVVLVDNYDPVIDDINIKIRCRGKILIKKMRRVDKLAKVYTYISEENNVPAAQTIIYFKDLPIYVNDTPKELGITLGDILECVVFPSVECSQKNKNFIDVKLQSKDSKVKTVISVHMVDHFSLMMEKYADLKGLPLDKLVFEFDGDKLSPNETPFDLDMENENVVDVRVMC